MNIAMWLTLGRSDGMNNGLTHTCIHFFSFCQSMVTCARTFCALSLFLHLIRISTLSQIASPFRSMVQSGLQWNITTTAKPTIAYSRLVIDVFCFGRYWLCRGFVRSMCVRKMCAQFSIQEEPRMRCLLWRNTILSSGIYCLVGIIRRWLP